MKMVMISYNSAINSEVMEVLERRAVGSYTKWIQVQGKGETSGSHFGSEVWPGENSVLMIAIDDNEKDKLIEGIKELRQRLGKEGIKAFVWSLEEIT